MAVDTAQHPDPIVSLREELKKWERRFSAQHDGRKPSQDDIRSDAEASAKYRQYNKLKRAQTQATDTPSKKGRRKYQTEETKHVLQERDPNIRPRSPEKRSVPEKEEDIPVIEPEILPTPAFIRCALGPTPQKDGQVLGIFDFMPSGTPSKNVSISLATDTPSKPTLCSSTADISATPRSTAKRSLFSAFTGTPQKRIRDEEHNTPSTSKRQFATPSFLRRDLFMPAIAEDEEQSAPLPFKKKSVVRSLSSMIQGLRHQEEERLDDELDILNELEAEAMGEPVRKKPKVLVENSQGIEMPLGPDQGDAGSDEEDDDDPRNVRDQPRKPWKKKGLKRQTKRVIMRPVTHKSTRSEAQTERVLETQVEAPTRDPADDAAYASGGELDYDDMDNVEQDKDNVMERSKTSRNEEGGGTIKKVAKKVSATAHANFRKLKIKNKNSKANGRGKFGRRR